MIDKLDSKTSSAARRRYRIVTMVSFGVYCLAVFTISGWFGWEPPKSGFGLYLAAVSPAVPIGVAIYAMIRAFGAEPDEFLRMMRMQAALIGLGLTMLTCTAWGFLSQYAHVWPLPLYMVFPMWAFWFGVTTPLVNLKYR